MTSSRWSRLLLEAFNLDPIVKSFVKISSFPSPEDPLEECESEVEEADEMKFFMVGGDERDGGKKWSSSKSSAKFVAERVTEVGGGDEGVILLSFTIHKRTRGRTEEGAGGALGIPWLSITIQILSFKIIQNY